MNKEKVNVGVMLDPKAVMPTKAYEWDAGFDLYTPKRVTVSSYSFVTIDTGVHMVIPEGYVGIIFTKSGLHTKWGMITTGVVDAGYTGTVKVTIHNSFEDEFYMLKGQKIAQIVILPLPMVELTMLDELPETQRGEKGFGSSGK